MSTLSLGEPGCVEDTDIEGVSKRKTKTHTTQKFSVKGYGQTEEKGQGEAEELPGRAWHGDPVGQ